MKTNKFLFLLSALTLCACSPTPGPEPGPEPEPVVTTYNVTYEGDLHNHWSGSSTIKEKTEFRAASIVSQGYVVKKEGITITVGDNQLSDSQFTFSSSVLIVPAEYVIGNIKVTSVAVPEHGEDEVDVYVNVMNATHNFETTAKKGVQLEGTLTPIQHYYLPDALVITSGTTELSVDSDYSYDADTGEIIIFADSVTDTINIAGNAISKIDITFQVGDGHWIEGGVDDKVASIKKGETLQDAITIGGIKNPVIDTQDYSFAGWAINGEIVGLDIVFNANATVIADYAEGIATITYDTEGITLTDAPQTISYKEALTISLKANKDFALPVERDIEIKDEESRPVEFIYDVTDDYRSATISVGEGVIESNIAIKIYAYDSYAIFFDPKGGTWSDETKNMKRIDVPVGATYGDALDLLHDEVDNPTISGKNFGNWLKEEQSIDEYAIIYGAPSQTFEAYYTAGQTFYSDSWENVVTYANQGIDKLKEEYPEVGDDFVGAKRPIIVNDANDNQVTAMARVIGVEHDETMAGSGTTLTMEIDYVISTDRYSTDDGSSLNWWPSSKLKSILNGELLTELKGLNPGLNVKAARKNTVIGGGYSKTTYTEEALFSLSGTEIGLPSSSETSEYAYSQIEGDTYAFYKAHESADQRIKFGESGAPTSYWLRSPSCGTYEDDTDNVYQIQANGDYSLKNAVNQDAINGIMVAFAI